MRKLSVLVALTVAFAAQSSASQDGGPTPFSVQAERMEMDGGKKIASGRVVKASRDTGDWKWLRVSGNAVIIIGDYEIRTESAEITKSQEGGPARFSFQAQLIEMQGGENVVTGRVVRTSRDTGDWKWVRVSGGAVIIIGDYEIRAESAEMTKRN